MLTLDDAERLAAQTIEVMTLRCAEACAYAEAYGHEGRTIVVDGSQYSPSSRALPNGERVWQNDTHVPETLATTWSVWDETVRDALEQLTVQCHDSDAHEDDPEYVWTFGWDEGCLFGYHPDYSDDAS